MPSVNFTVKWPNGEVNQYYSPSSIIYDYLRVGQVYSLTDFVTQVENGLEQASERVRLRYGFACSAAMDNLASIKRHINILSIQAQDQIEITEMTNE
ncbi:MSMEG_0570 family nitrogen starvation response protein [Acinetobacter nosocomialis]|uniref:MSMEG_0570 family nitrogen starvation response protein n=1 Tax=Acinetobacter nosocomialis TaxID=106654 RepID=UPI001C0BF3EF|nr:MSMEG_0570 family nitrogen starvation response protein [Acinetobacter nosocomialis]MBU3118153.1 MSMEG_0570 family nitrogen starvation response protein [Acinetobacter nosocomialis]